eukprot:gene13820-23335_t
MTEGAAMHRVPAPEGTATRARVQIGLALQRFSLDVAATRAAALSAREREQVASMVVGERCPDNAEWCPDGTACERFDPKLLVAPR